jgi:peptidyl-prolyl cis-trans isomerase C
MKKLVSLLILTTLLFVGCGEKEPAMDMRVVAKAGDLEFTVFDLDCYMLRMNYKDADDELYKKTDFLNQHLEKLLIADAGIKLGLLDSVEVDTGQVSRILYETVYRNEITHKLNVNDKTTYKFWQKYGGQLHLALILVDSEELADSLYDVLKGDPDKFGELAAAFSEDRGSKDNDGDIGWRRFTDIPYELLDVCFSLKPGAISAPVKSQFGWNIVRFFERNKFTEEDYAAEKQIYQQQYSLFRRSILQRDLAERLIPVLHYKLDHDALLMLIDEGTKLRDEKYTPDTPLSKCISSSDLSEEDLSRTLASFDGFNYTIDDFFSDLRRQYSREGLNFDAVDYAEYSVLMFVLPRMMRQYGFINKIQDTPEFARQYNDAKIGLIYQKMLHDYILDTVVVSDDEVKERYEKTIFNYTKPEQIECWEIQLNTEQEANDILNQLKHGKPFKDLVGLTARPGFAEKGGYLGMCTSQVYYWAYAAAKGRKQGDYAGPIEQDGKWSIIRVGKRIPEKVTPLSEVESSVRDMTLGAKKYAVKNAWVDQRKKEVENFIDYDLVKKP